MTRTEKEIRRLATRMLYAAGILLDLAESQETTPEEMKQTCALVGRQLYDWKPKEISRRA